MSTWLPWLLPACAIAAANPTDRPPNVIIVLADDLGWTDVGCYGSRYYRTPHIDRLARQGVQFSAAYANAPNCAPTRACLLTGRATPRHGVFTVTSGERGRAEFRRMQPVDNRELLPLGEVTLAQTLRAAGYVTGHFGKWHLGDEDRHHPLRRGFSEAVVTYEPHHLAPGFKTSPADRLPAGTDLADYLTDRAVDFIERHRAQPFFLYLPHFAVHVPLQSSAENVARFRDLPAHGGHHDPRYAAMVDRLDQSVGRILQTLQALGLDDRTLIVFTSDNGGVGSYPGLGGSVCRGLTGNEPLRGGKGMLYEGGIRVPLIARWPGTIDEGALCTQPVQLFDLYATVQELAGARQPATHPIDARSLGPLLRGGAAQPHDALFWHFPGYLEADVDAGTWRTTPAAAVRRGRYKLIEFFETGCCELYDLENDIGERHDLAGELPELANELRAALTGWRSEVGAALPRRR